MPNSNQGSGQQTVINLDDYRTIPTIEIKLLPGGSVEYSTANIHEENAFDGLLGCYVVAGEMLNKLREMRK